MAKKLDKKRYIEELENIEAMLEYKESIRIIKDKKYVHPLEDIQYCLDAAAEWFFEKYNYPDFEQ